MTADAGARELVAEWARIRLAASADEPSVPEVCAYQTNPGFANRAVAALEAALAAQARAEQERDEALSLLREVEWSGSACHDYGSSPACPACERDMSGGDKTHAPDCKLAALLAKHAPKEIP